MLSRNSTSTQQLKIIVVRAGQVGNMMANMINTVRMAEGFAQLGHDTTILGYKNRQIDYSNEDLAHLYGIDSSIKWKLLSEIPTRAKRARRHWGFATVALPYVLLQKPDLIFARNRVLPSITSYLGIPSVVESHTHVDANPPQFKRMLKSTHHKGFKLLITISPVLRDYYIEQGAQAEKIIILPTGVNVDLFSPPSILPDSPYDKEGRNIVYCGHLYDYKGVPSILEAAKLLPRINFHLVGGLDEDINRVKYAIEKQAISNVKLYGMLNQSDLPPFLWNADILLLPPSNNHPSAKWTSPVKMGEYLAAQVPIIATTIPALKYWLSDEHVFFTEPDNGAKLAQTIQYVLDHPEESQKRIQAGQVLANQLSFQARAARIISMAQLGERTNANIED